MKTILYTLILLTWIQSSVYATPNNTKNEIKELRAQQKKIAVAIFNLRKDLIQTDPKLNKLHKEKMRLHREIAEKISSNKKMGTLIETAIKLNEKIKTLEKNTEVSTENKVDDSVEHKVIDETADPVIKFEDNKLSYE
jgi:septal ring factor EnvC (AmiA/AmiB activator)